MKSIGITGGNGMLGREIKELAEKCGYPVRIYDLPEYDITSDENLEEIVSDNDVIVNCAAYTAVDQAETDQEICRAINADAVGKLGKLVKSSDKYVVHISTDFVFGDNGEKLLREEDAAIPLSVYGTTKLGGELQLGESGCQNAVIRVEWTYGKYGNHFISKIAELAEKMGSLKVVDDQFGAPTPTTAVARAVLCFLKDEVTGLYHFAARGCASRYEVAKLIFSEMGIEKPLSPCASSEFSTPAQRPLNSRFDCAKIDQVLDFERPEWKEALIDFLEGEV